MSTVSPRRPDSTASFLANLGKPAATRFFVVEAPPRTGGGYRVVDRQNPMFVKSYSGRDEADDDCTKLNRCPPAKRPLFPVSAVRITPAAPAPAKMVPCYTCGATVKADEKRDRVRCPGCETMAVKLLGEGELSASKVSPAKIESCWTCGELCPSDGKCDPLHCARCRRAKATSPASHTVATLADDALVELGAAVADEIARRLGSVPEPVRMVAAIDPVDPYFAPLDAAVGAGAA